MNSVDKLRRCLLLFRALRKDPYGRFLKAGGDRLLVENFNLNAESLVVDFGGFRGDWAAAMIDNYGVQCLIVEPIPSFAEAIARRFEGDSRVRIMCCGFGKEAGKREIYLADDATGINAHGIPISVEFCTVTVLGHFIATTGVSVASVNIEGGEYELLESLLDSGLISVFKTLLIQFHHIDKISEMHYEKLQQQLLLGHNLTWDYPYVWQRWDRK